MNFADKDFQKLYESYLAQHGHTELAFFEASFDKEATSEDPDNSKLDKLSNRIEKLRQTTLAADLRSGEMLNRQAVLAIAKNLLETIADAILSKFGDQDEWIENELDPKIKRAILEATNEKPYVEGLHDLPKRAAENCARLHAENAERHKNTNLGMQYRAKQLNKPNKNKEEIVKLVFDRLIEAGWDNPSDLIIDYVIKEVLFRK